MTKQMTEIAFLQLGALCTYVATCHDYSNNFTSLRVMASTMPRRRLVLTVVK